MSNRLANKRIVITGAARGIGRATSILAASEGAVILAVDQSGQVADTVEQIVSQGGQAIAVQADAGEESDVKGFVDQCVSKFGGIDGLYANAGVAGGGKQLTELTVEDWQRTLRVNTVGVFLAVKHSVPHFTGQGSGAMCVLPALLDCVLMQVAWTTAPVKPVS